MENYSSISSQFVIYKIALKLKELGFAPIMAAAFQTQEENRLIIHWYNKRDFEIAPHLLPAPLWQQAIDYLREHHEIIVSIEPDNISEDKIGWYIYIYKISDLLDTTKVFDFAFKLEDYKNPLTYHKTREQAILKAIELIKHENVIC